MRGIEAAMLTHARPRAPSMSPRALRRVARLAFLIGFCWTRSARSAQVIQLESKSGELALSLADSGWAGLGRFHWFIRSQPIRHDIPGWFWSGLVYGLIQTIWIGWYMGQINPVH